MVLRFPAHIWDSLVAPEMSKFTTASIPDMSQVDSEQEHWQQNFFFNNLLRGRLQSPHRQQLYNFLRRSHSAFESFAQAREDTLAFLEAPEPSFTYVDAIGHWEAFLAYSWQAYTFLGTFLGVKWFEKGDASTLQRLNALHNRAKHAAEAIERGDFIEDSPMCVWLTDDGLRSTDYSLSFAEMAEVLEDLASWATAVQDPLTMRAKVKERLDELSDGSADAEDDHSK